MIISCEQLEKKTRKTMWKIYNDQAWLKITYELWCKNFLKSQG